MAYLDCLVDYPSNCTKVTKKEVNGTLYVYYEYGRFYKKETKHSQPQRHTIGKISDEYPDKMFPNERYYKYFSNDDMSSNTANIVEKESPVRTESEVSEVTEESTAKLYTALRPTEVERSCCISIGAFIAIQKIIKDYSLDTILKDCIGDETYAGLFLDYAAYEIICQSNVAQHFPSYAYRHPLFTPKMKIYSDSSLGIMFETLTANSRQEFLNKWNENRNTREKIYISYDSTNRHSMAGDIQLIEYGHAKDSNNKVPIINQGMAFDSKYKEPLWYTSYPGSIVDVNTLIYTVETAKSYGYRNIGFILDRGYFAKQNLFYMDENEYSFIIMAKGKAGFLHKLIEEAMGTFELDRRCLISRFRVMGTTIIRKLFPDDTRDRFRYVHVYFNELRAAAERDRMEDNLCKWTTELSKCIGKRIGRKNLSSYERYFELNYDKNNCLQSFEVNNEVVDEEKFWMGYFTIVTSAEMTAEEALVKYKGRDSSEKLFMIDKTFPGNECYHVDSQSSMETKEWIGFTAEIIRNRIYTCLISDDEKQYSNKNRISVPDCICELEKYEIVQQLNGTFHIDHTLTKRQRELFRMLNLSQNEVESEATKLCKIMTSLESDAAKSI